MWRWIFFLTGLCLVVVGVVWFVQNPGDVSLQWQGWRLDTSVGVMMAAVLLFAALTAAIYRFWRFLRAVPGEIGSAMKERRKRKGYTALSSGMVAVAAGDASEARRHARRAEALLSESAPLTRLLSAQSAQLDGDEKAAERFFTEMLDDPETKFLGLRGLLTQAVKAGNKGRALELAQSAYRLQPKSEWVAATLFDLQSGSGSWLNAADTNDDMARKRLLARPEADRRRAVIAFELAREAEASANGAQAMKQLKSACDLAPDLIPACVALMRRYVADGQHRKAVALGEKIWAKTPHPDLLDPYWEARKAPDGLVRVKASEKLASINPDHAESHIALARAALGAELWGEARKHLQVAGAGGGLEPQARICRMMAELEERENGDLTKAREWLVRSGSAPEDEKWVCSECGNAVEVWTAHCGNCNAFDSYAWRKPTHISGLPKPVTGAAGPAAMHVHPTSGTALAPSDPAAVVTSKT
ncbi:heme biosynthesis HemY N-terminal domain-containing protein [Thalassospiraceae bacterium LMO-JJ14]|nr:heme biosynthesis HemY N-terminal domain-containing protein [Thalassospiraceae bacterium LMO-JJ14]